MDVRLTREQVRSVDAVAIEQLQMPGLILMENAGRGAAEHTLRLAEDRGAGRVVIFCGPGNNGGDGFVIARHLFNVGVKVRLLLTAGENALKGDAEVNHRIVRNLGLAVEVIDTAEKMTAAAGELNASDLVVDSLLGTGFRGEVREPLDKLITAINQAPKAGVVAVDTPSGLDCNTGQPGGVAIQADLTATFVAAKVGFFEPGASKYTGDVQVVSIGTPPSLVEQVLSQGAW